jgi:hypothetical protein
MTYLGRNLQMHHLHFENYLIKLKILSTGLKGFLFNIICVYFIPFLQTEENVF